MTRDTSKRVLRSSSISKVEPVNSSKTDESARSELIEDAASCDGDTVVLERTTEGFIALSGDKSKICDNLSEDLVRQAASNFKALVVSLASFDGNTMLAECTGVFMECPDPNTARFLTSSSLFASSDGEKKISAHFRIEVRHANGGCFRGQLVHYDSYYGFAVVSTRHLPGCEVDHRLVLDDHEKVLKSSSQVVALWCSFSSEKSSDKLMANRGQLIGTLDGTVHKLMFSTCEISWAGVGGPLIDLDGNFVGMNCYRKEIADRPGEVVTPCLPRNIILKFMELSGIIRLETKQEVDGTVESSTSKIHKFSKHGNYYLEGFFAVNPDYKKYIIETSESLGYPLPNPAEESDVMYMVNTFEEKFDKDTWTKLRKDIASKMSKIVVPLASFNGNARFFACTGVFIGNNKCYQTILTSASLVRISGKDPTNLRIEVRLLNKREAIGELVYCNFDYNIALVNIKETIPQPTIDLQHPPVTSGTRVKAIGCLFDGCRLMATDGKVTKKCGTLDCKELMISTCNITKAGIGGPLIDTKGNFVGMNFYGNKETSFLPATTLSKILGKFLGKWPLDAVDVVGNADKKSWRVPKPSWIYPTPEEPLLEEPPRDNMSVDN